jgi:hypothetical protein
VSGLLATAVPHQDRADDMSEQGESPLNGSGISTSEPKPEDYEDFEDFLFAWKEWAAEYPWMKKRGDYEQD